MAPIAASIAAGLNALIPAKVAAIPVVAGLVVGTAAGASFISASPADVMAGAAPAALTSAIVAPANAAPAPAASSVGAAPAPTVAAPPPAALRACEMQTWPYMEGRCVAGAPADKQVRVVTAGRSGEMPQHVKSPVPLMTSDTVLRAPQNIDAIPTAKAESAKPEKRKEVRRKRDDRRYAAQTYRVPSETQRDSRAVIVVHPMRLETYR